MLSQVHDMEPRHVYQSGNTWTQTSTILGKCKRDQQKADILPAIVNKGLFFTGGSAWKRLRRLMTPTFTAGKLKNSLLQPQTTQEQSNIGEVSVELF
ncbi:hypothetical protein C0Q70_13345 [Pomacea canaliculata]|uniref:Cytochrome P450 n=1 Tax=Pomacea canaliculata TaxID=400727 RepID=A0A2T7NWZ7_POMCA|nr:hypothetical protein C0Q70_13345 [Pomacea canaliculata]